MSVAFKESEFLIKNNIFSSCLLIDVVDEKNFHFLKIKRQAVRCASVHRHAQMKWRFVSVSWFGRWGVGVDESLPHDFIE